MSVHLIECAAELQLPPALKLALLCFADSGSQDGRIAKPGLDNLMRWTGLKKSRALEVVKHLQELQLLTAHRAAHRGQRAEYIVFPNGCCDRHGKASATALSVVEDAAIAQVAPLTSTSKKGSGPADPFSDDSISTGSGPADPVPTNGSDPDPGKGPADDEKGSDPRPEKGPASTLKTGALQVLPPKAELQERTPTGHQPTELTTRTTPDRRDNPVIDIVFSEPSRAIGVRVPPPSGAGRALGCRHCDAGYITDADGIPLLRCPHCNAAQADETA